MAQTTIDDRVPDAASAASPSLLDRTFDLVHVSGERLAWLLLLPLALVLRVIWLHGWPLNPTEGALASTMWSLLTRGQATLPPIEPGPVVALLGTFWLFLFGAFEDSLRLGTALAGWATVAACWWLRPALGRHGALLGAALLTWSPLALYQARRLTPEPYAVLFLLILVVCLLQLYRGGGRTALVMAAVATTLAVFSHYLALPIALLLIVSAPVAARLALLAPATDAGGRVGAYRAPMLNARDWGLAALAVGVVVFVLGLLTASGGFPVLETLLGPLTAWAVVSPPPERSALFVPLQVLVYEPLILVAGLAGVWLLGVTREQPAHRLAGLLLVAWAVLGLLLGALAGDRSPAQALYGLVPLALLAGRLIAAIVAGIPWPAYRRQAGPVLTAVSALALIALILVFDRLTTPAAALGIAHTVTLLLDALLMLLLVAATIYLIRPFGRQVGGRIISLTLLAVLALYGIRSATQLAFVHPASATELAVQQQTTPGLTAIVDRIHRLARDTTGLRRSDADLTGGHGLEIAIDQTLTSPFDWYLRDYPRRSQFAPNSGPSGTPQLIIISAEGEANARALLDKDYVGQRYPFLWSFPSDGLSGSGRELVRYLLYREPARAPSASEFAVYLRRDLADRVLFKGEAAASGAPAASQAVAFNLFDRNGRGRAPGQFDSPRGIAIDRNGAIYVVDTVNTRLQKFDATGVFQWSTGSAGSGSGQFARIQNGPGPTGIAADQQGNIFVADTWNHRIVKFDDQGRFLTAWGSFINTQGNPEVARQNPRSFFGPRSIAIGPDNNIYVTDTGNKRVLVFDGEGKPLRQWGGLGTGPTNLNEPVGIAIDRAGTVYVADTNNGRIAVFDLQGQPRVQWPVAGWGASVYQEPYIAVTDDVVFVTSGVSRSVLRFDKQGKLLGEERRLGDADLLSPTGIAIGSDGTLYVVDTGAHAVVRGK